MFVCSICQRHSDRGEATIPVLLEIREVTYRSGDKFPFGWEIVKEGFAAASHKHTLHRGPVFLDKRGNFYFPTPYVFFHARLKINRLVRL